MAQKKKRYFEEIEQDGKHLAPVKGTDNEFYGSTLDDSSNRASGTGRFREVDISELQGGYSPWQQMLRDVLGDTGKEIANRVMDYAEQKTTEFVEATVIPATKKKAKKVSENIAIGIAAFKDVLAGKEPKAVALLKEAEKLEKSKATQMVSRAVDDEQERSSNTTKTIRTPEEVEDIVKHMYACAILIASDIRKLADTYVSDECSIEQQEEYKKLCNDRIMGIIDFLLMEENREMLDLSTQNILEEFKSGNLIIDGKPMSIKELAMK